MVRGLIQKFVKLFGKRQEMSRQFRWVARKARPCLPRLFVVFLLQSLCSVIAIALTLINKQIIDSAIADSGSFNKGAFILLVSLTLVNILISVCINYFAMLVSERYTFLLRSQLYDSILHSKWYCLKKYHSGDIQTRLTGDMDTVANGIAGLVPEFLAMILRLMLAFVVLIRYDVMLALAALLLGPLGVLASLLFSGKMHDYQMKARENESRMRSFMQESTENITVVKAFSMEEESLTRFAKLRGERLAIVRRQGFVSGMSRMAMNLVFSTGHMLAFGWGILRVSRAEITYGTMSVFLSLVSQISGPIMGMGNILPRLISMLTAAGRVMELENMDAEERKRALSLSGQTGVRLQNVSFTYDKELEEREPVLTDISLDIHPGESVALIGATGSGKTTIARLLLDLIEPESGKVCFYDRRGQEEQASPSTRSLIAYVPQGNTMSSGTIRENLVVGREVPDEAVKAALITAEAGFALELGLDTRIGEHGIGLSEGQAQRLAIARALLRGTSFLILDEASASLDMETERRIMENLKSAKNGITCLVITHRPSLLAICDRCYQVKNGNVLEVSKEKLPVEWQMQSETLE